MNHMNYWPFDDYQSDDRFRALVRNLREATHGGVAFIGAGASVAAGMPTWTDFHKSFLAHFGAQPAPLPANRHQALLVDVDYHTDRDSARALSFVKKTFAVPVSVIPPVVRLTRATRSIRYFYTTNLDEVLFEAADSESVSVYPKFIPMDARFVYLHGRASTANSIHEDLGIVCISPWTAV